MRVPCGCLGGELELLRAIKTPTKKPTAIASGLFYKEWGKGSGEYRSRTDDLLHAMQAL